MTKKGKEKHTVSVSEFKAKALAYMAKAAEKAEEYVITKNGTPIVKVVPIQAKRKGSRRGSLKGLAEVQGDIVRFDSSEDWDVLGSK